MTKIKSIAQLNEIYGEPGKASIIKETANLIPHYRRFIEASPFCILATIGDERDQSMMDCSPRGDVTGFVRVHDDRTLMMPDRRGNNRVDSLRNIVTDPRVALCFMVPGSRNCLRVNGEAHLSIEPELLESFSVKDQPPRSVIVIHTRSIYFQCGRAIIRSELWNPNSQSLAQDLPSPGQVLAFISDNEVGGPEYDEKWDGRAVETLW